MMPEQRFALSRTGTAGQTRDFWIFWLGQTISNLGNAITLLAVPLLIFRLTGSALNHAAATVATYLPYAQFGLVIGAWVDRVDRKRLMLGADAVRALLLASIPIHSWSGTLSIWWVYVVGFLCSTLGIGFQSAEFAAIPSLVDKRDLVSANGRIQASYAAASVAGPLLAGLLFGLAGPVNVLLFDAATFAVSVASLALIRRSFNPPADEVAPSGGLRAEIVDGLRYVLRHPVLRAISLMMALVNFVASTTTTQLVFFAKERFAASDARISLLYSAGGAGMVLLSLLAGRLRRRWSFSGVALSALVADGLLTVAFALAPSYWVALPIWGLVAGAGILFNINTGSLRQTIVPNHLLGRVVSVAGVLAWSSIPLGSFLGSLLITWTGSVALIYGGIGLTMALIATLFSFSALAHADRYLPDAPDGAPAAAREPRSLSA
jgi:MFS family permease